MPYLQPAEIQWMYNCQKCLVGCIFDGKMEIAVINTPKTGIFTSTFFVHWQKYIQNCQKYIHFMPELHTHFQDCHKYIHYTYFIFIHLTKKIKLERKNEHIWRKNSKVLILVGGDQMACEMDCMTGGGIKNVSGKIVVRK